MDVHAGRIANLRRIHYFADTSEAVLVRLSTTMTRHSYAAGELIFLEGDPAGGLCIVEAGSVKIYKLSPDGGEHVLHIIGAGGTFNDIAALDGDTNPANAAALSDVTLWLLPADALHTAIQSDPALALRTVQALAARVRKLVGQIEDLALYSVVVRLARFLLRQAEDPALAGPGVTRVAIAAHLATTPQTISTALRELEATGALEFDRHRIVIIDETLLRDIAML